jgi:hypothetical protein
MLLKKVTLAALAGTVLLAAAPAFADQGRGDRHQFRGDRHQFRGDHFQNRGSFVNNHAPRYYGQHRFIVQRPYLVQRPAVVYRDHYGHQVLGGLILGTVIGAAIANHAGGNY